MSNSLHETPPYAIGKQPQPHSNGSGAHFPAFTRLNYFYGQLLEAQDFRTEQEYFREKFKLHNRCLHGYGTVCGLEVVPVPIEAACPPHTKDEVARLQEEIAKRERELEQARSDKDEKRVAELLAALSEEQAQLKELLGAQENDETQPTRVQVQGGLALDCDGNELIVGHPIAVDLWRELSPEDRRKSDPKGQTLYVSLCYCPRPFGPARPVLMDACGTAQECAYGKIRDSVRVKVTIDPPPPDERCGTCCSECGDACLLLARISGFRPGQELRPTQIDNGVRRMIGLYPHVTITGINWVHGADYTPQDARKILGTDDELGGIEISFSGDVLPKTITRGVVDLWVIEGGRGRAGNIYNMGNEVHYVPEKRLLRCRQTTEESLQLGDRVLITVRTSFILDKCCRPVDGDHVGGRVPTTKSPVKPFRMPEIESCLWPPLKFGAWTSGNGTPGGTFESWFYIDSDHKDQVHKK